MCKAFSSVSRDVFMYTEKNSMTYDTKVVAQKQNALFERWPNVSDISSRPTFIQQIRLAE